MRVALLVGGALLLGCGQPQAGGACRGTGFDCADLATALECRAGTWAAVPCRGDGGCARGATEVSCAEKSDNAEGSRCGR